MDFNKKDNGKIYYGLMLKEDATVPFHIFSSSKLAFECVKSYISSVGNGACIKEYSIEELETEGLREEIYSRKNGEYEKLPATENLLDKGLLEPRGNESFSRKFDYIMLFAGIRLSDLGILESKNDLEFKKWCYKFSDEIDFEADFNEIDLVREYLIAMGL